jgi:hypothetical protein
VAQLRAERHVQPIEGMWNQLQQRCDNHWMKVSTLPYRAWESKSGINPDIAYRGRILLTQVLELALLARLENNRNYANQAQAILLSATDQVTPDLLSAHDSDLMVGDTAHALAVGLDWLWPWLDADQRRDLLGRVQVYGAWIAAHSQTEPWGRNEANREISNWNGVLHGSLGLCGLWTGNQAWVQRALLRCQEHLATDLDATGFPLEGLGYALYGKADVFPFLEALKLRDGHDYLADNTQLPLFVAAYRSLWIPGRAENIPWNQVSPVISQTGSFWNLLAHCQDKESCWWWYRTFGAPAQGGNGSYGASDPGAPGLVYCLLWCDPTLKPVRPPASEWLHRFALGLVTARSGWSDDDSIFSFNAINAPGSFWHHADQGGFTLYFRGEGFSVEAGAGAKTSDTHSTLLFDGQDQDADGGPSSNPVKLTRCDAKGGWLIAGGDLKNAYARKAKVAAYQRQVAYNRGPQPCVVVYDQWKRAIAPTEVGFLLITDAANKLAPTGPNQWRITGARGKANCTVAFPLELKIQMTTEPLLHGSERVTFHIANPAGSLLAVLAASPVGQAPTDVSFPTDLAAALRLGGKNPLRVEAKNGQLVVGTGLSK